VSFQQGLSNQTSVGGFGFYTSDERDDPHAFSTYAWSNGRFSSYGDCQDLFSLALPDQHSVEISGRSWTGMQVAYQCLDERIEVQLRTTLPGPLITTSAEVLSLRIAIKHDTREVTNLETGDMFLGRDKWLAIGGASFLYVRSDRSRFLIVSSVPVENMIIESGRHWKVHFAQAGASILMVPLLGDTDAASLMEHRDVWSSLVAEPPLTCSESFEWSGTDCRIRQEFAGVAWAPAPPVWQLFDAGRSPVSQADDYVTLVPTVFGPYKVRPGDTAEYTLAGDWLTATIEPTAEPEGPFGPLPDELMYAGDFTWDETGVMDALLSCRSWAPLLGVMPEGLRSELLARFTMPTGEQLSESALVAREPVLGRRWARDHEMWEERGQALYDPDWSNGLMLSGLQRATVCPVPELAEAAQETAHAAQETRGLYLAYYEVYHEWMTGMAWTDPRGLLWLSDCCRNGMEGIVAEAKLREQEGDEEGAGFARYLALKTGIGLIAAVHLAQWAEKVCPPFVVQPTGADAAFLKADYDERVFATNGFTVPFRLSPITPATRNPYHLAGLFPEFTALIRKYGELEAIRELAGIWAEEYPQRYERWVEFYVGEGWRERFARDRDQEARVQAAVFYHIEPDCCTRLWLLEEDPAEIEGRFREPINLAQQLLLRANFRLSLQE